MCIRDSAYGAGSGATDELVMVFDLGGGTLDVSVLQAHRRHPRAHE